MLARGLLVIRRVRTLHAAWRQLSGLLITTGQQFRFVSCCRHDGSTAQRMCGGTHEQTSDSQRRVAYQHCLHVPLWQEPVHVSTKSLDHTGDLVASVETVNSIPRCFACSRTCAIASMKAQSVVRLHRNLWSCKQTNQVSENILSGVSQSFLCCSCLQKGNLSVRKTCTLPCRSFPSPRKTCPLPAQNAFILVQVASVSAHTCPLLGYLCLCSQVACSFLDRWPLHVRAPY